MSRTVQARLPWHVVATGFGADDFISLSHGPEITIPPGCTEDDVAQFASRELALQHPAARDRIGANDRRLARARIDAESEVSIVRAHARKAAEAERVLFDGATDLVRLPYLAADLAARGDDATLAEVAAEVWAQAVADADAEAARVEAKRQAG